jgi:hypothetical protein
MSHIVTHGCTTTSTTAAAVWPICDEGHGSDLDKNTWQTLSTPFVFCKRPSKLHSEDSFSVLTSIVPPDKVNCDTRSFSVLTSIVPPDKVNCDTRLTSCWRMTLSCASPTFNWGDCFYLASQHLAFSLLFRNGSLCDHDISLHLFQNILLHNSGYTARTRGDPKHVHCRFVAGGGVFLQFRVQGAGRQWGIVRVTKTQDNTTHRIKPKTNKSSKHTTWQQPKTYNNATLPSLTSQLLFPPVNTSSIIRYQWLINFVKDKKERDLKRVLLPLDR